MVHITSYLTTPCVFYLDADLSSHTAGCFSALVIINCQNDYSLCGNIHLLNDKQTVQVLTVQGNGTTEHAHGNNTISDNVPPLAMAH